MSRRRRRSCERALADLGIAASAIQAGIDCGLAQLEAGRPRFSHPLAQAAALEVAAPAQRRLAHEALARAWSEAGEPERAAWHLAEAGDGPGRARLVRAGRRRAGRSRARRAGRGGRGVAAGGRDGARRGSGAAAAPGAGARSRAGGTGRRGAGRARRDPRPRARRGSARGRRDPAGPAPDLAGPHRAGRPSAGRGRGADPGPRSGARGGDALRGGVRQGEPRRGDRGRRDRRGGRRARRAAGRIVGGGGQVDARVAPDRGRGGRPRLSAAAAARRARRPVARERRTAGRGRLAWACSPAGWRTTTPRVASSSARSRSRASEVSSATCRSR